MLPHNYLASLCIFSLCLVKLISASPITPGFLGIRSDLFQGDMILTADQQRNGIIGDRYRWPGGVVSYEFDSAFSKLELISIFIYKLKYFQNYKLNRL